MAYDFVNVTNRAARAINPETQEATLSQSGIVAILRTALSEDDWWVSPEDLSTPDLTMAWEKHSFMDAQIGVFPRADEHRVDHYDHISLGLLWPLMHELGELVDRAIETMTKNSQGVVIFDDAEKALEARAYGYRRYIDRENEAMQELDCSDRICLVHDFTCAGVTSDTAAANVYTVHTPFPSAKFVAGVQVGDKSLAETEFMRDFLSRMMSYDIVTMHTDKDVKNFQDVVMMVDPDAYVDDIGNIHAFGKTSQAKRVHVGIDRDVILEEAAAAEFSEDVQKRFIDPIQGKKAVLSVARHDYTKGTMELADSIDTFLTNNPERVEDSVFIVVRQPSRNGLDGQEQYQQAADGRFAELEKRFPGAIVYENKGMPHDQLMKFMQQEELRVITALPTTNEGHDLTVREFVDVNPEGSLKAVIATRGVGAMSVLGLPSYDGGDQGGAFKVDNAAATDQIVAALETVLSDGNESEIIARFNGMHEASAAASGKSYLDQIRHDVQVRSQCPLLQADAFEATH